MPAHVPEVLLAVRKADDGRRRADDDDGDGGPPRDPGEDHHEGHHADDRGDDREIVVEDIDRTGARFALGVLKAFVEFRVVEGGEIHLPGLAHDFQIDVVDDQLARDVVEDARDPPHHAREEVESEPQKEQEDHAVEHHLSARGDGHIGRGQSVEQGRSDVRADHGRHAVPHRHEDHEEQDPRFRIPHQPEDIEQAVEEFRHHPPHKSRDFAQGLGFRFL